MIRELRAFQIVVALVLLLPLGLGLVGAFGGLDAHARLASVEGNVEAPPALRSDLRALAWMFAGIVPLTWWCLRDFVGRANGFRIIFGFAALAGLVRLIGWFADGPGGTNVMATMAVELGMIPLVLLWHARLVRKLRAASAA